MGEPGERWQWNLRELQDAFRSAISIVLKRQVVWLFIDAVDESGKTHAIELVRHLRKLLASISPENFQFLICITCRHYPVLDLGSAYEIALEGENEKDISAYVQDRLSLVDEKSASRIADVITNRADGIFMWASLQIDRALELERNGASLAKTEAEILSTPRGLFGVYEELVQNMKERSKSLKMIQWICFAMRPLSLDELRWVLAVDADRTSPIKSLKKAQESDEYITSSERMELRLKSLSCGLVEAVLSLDRRVAQFIHQSVRDFFVETGISALDDSLSTCGNNSNCAIGKSHHQISRTCIRYVQMNEVIQSPAHGDALEARFPLLYYAAKFWMKHAKQAEQNGIAQNDLLLYFGWPSPKLLRAWRRICCQISYDLFDRPPAWTSMLHMLSDHRLITPLEVLLSPANKKDVKVNERDAVGYTSLLQAARDGYWDVVELLLSAHDIDINARDSGGRTALLCAVSRGHMAIVRLLLERDGIDINAQDDYGQTALIHPVYPENVAIVRLLLERDGIDINAQDDFGQTALASAVSLLKMAVVRLILEMDDININARDNHGQTALFRAVSGGDVDILRLLLDKDDIDINARDSQGQTALLYAVSLGHMAAVRLLLESDDININARDSQGQTALLGAVFRGHGAIVGLLLDMDDIDVNVLDAEGLTPLLCATQQEHVAIAGLLLNKHHVDVNVRDTEGLTPLLYATRNNYQSISELLLASKRADADAQNDSGRTPLSYAAQNGHVTAIKIYATDHKEVIDLKDVNGKTPLWYAARAGQLEAASILIQNGADVAAASDSGEGTPLHMAASSGWTDVIELLIKNQADVGAAAGNGITPLHAASSLGRADAIKLLIENGAQIEAEDIVGHRPLHMAICSGDMESVKLLLGEGADPHAAARTGEKPWQLALERAGMGMQSVRLARQFEAENWLWLDGLLYSALENSSDGYL
ncbi:nb-arc and ankyrin domain containing protein [Akanthomyces lecanii RCEF 1005]|uniref:Nb-arc and ankyrin domain containing protein n=1 Tax=Akanthomyces lecanii RCEF 1005 TaxID=1081108 RepID=A0A168F952_CORDF|nr:nb-arc and ankyrin domain containing protein [Akanthomyces lecanii RCEF 1005]